MLLATQFHTSFWPPVDFCQLGGGTLQHQLGNAIKRAPSLGAHVALRCLLVQSLPVVLGRCYLYLSFHGSLVHVRLRPSRHCSAATARGLATDLTGRLLQAASVRPPRPPGSFKSGENCASFSQMSSALIMSGSASQRCQQQLYGAHFMRRTTPYHGSLTRMTSASSSKKGRQRTSIANLFQRQHASSDQAR